MKHVLKGLHNPTFLEKKEKNSRGSKRGRGGENVAFNRLNFLTIPI